MFFPTLEARWFYPGTVPEQVREWFTRSDPAPSRQPARVDYYLRLQSSHALGIKLRQGSIEIKHRSHQYGSATFHRHVTGVIEHWRKWSLPLAATGEGLDELLVPRSSWVAVSKERMLRSYGYNLAGQIVATAELYAERGCHLELTNVQVGDSVWWTLAFEAYGDESSLRSVLAPTIVYILEREGAPCPLDGRDSFGYARWLALQDRGA
jgi:hypothetical protein